MTVTNVNNIFILHNYCPIIHLSYDTEGSHNMHISLSHLKLKEH